MDKVFVPDIVEKHRTDLTRSELRLAVKAQAKLAQMNLVRELLSNPVVELVAGIAAISYLNKGSQSWLESISGIDLAAGGEFAGLIAIIGLQQIAPLVPSIVNSPAAGEALKLLPMAALAGV